MVFQPVRWDVPVLEKVLVKVRSWIREVMEGMMQCLELGECCMGLVLGVCLPVGDDLLELVVGGLEGFGRTLQ